MISAVGTNSDTKRGKKFGTFDQCLGEKRENYLENSAQQMPEGCCLLRSPWDINLVLAQAQRLKFRSWQA